MRSPQLGQNLSAGFTSTPQLAHGTVETADDFFVVFGGALLARFGRGSSATGSPQSLHCGTPMGVNALHASHTNPTSISL
jgi:hypothetical protein